MLVGEQHKGILNTPTEHIGNEQQTSNCIGYLAIKDGNKTHAFEALHPSAIKKIDSKYHQKSTKKLP